MDDIFPPLYVGSVGAPYSTCAVKSVKRPGGPYCGGGSPRDAFFSVGGSLSKDEEMRALTQEIKILQDMDHANIVKTLGHTFGSPPDSSAPVGHMLLLELCDCDLGSLIAGKAGFVSWSEWLRLATEIAAGLAYIHTWKERNIAHLDLKPANVLIQKASKCTLGQVKLADFGSQFTGSSSSSRGNTPRPHSVTVAGKEDEEEPDDTPFGSFEYMAPEAWHRKYGVPGMYSDIFGVGKDKTFGT